VAIAIVLKRMPHSIPLTRQRHTSRCLGPAGWSGMMAGMRFTLGKMFLAIAMLALAFAGILYHDHFWACVIFSATLILFTWGGMVVVSTSSANQAAVTWFVIVGVSYLLLKTCPLIGDYGQYAVTNYALAGLTRVMRQGYVESYPLASIVKVNYRTVDFNETAKPLFTIGHCVFSWIFAVVAAWFAGRMYERRERATEEAT
jgi:hypothetical protein